MAVTLMDGETRTSAVLTIVNGVETHDFTDQHRNKTSFFSRDSKRSRHIHHNTGSSRHLLPPVGFKEVRSLMHRLECSLTLHCQSCSDRLPPVTTQNAATKSKSGHSQTVLECDGAFIESKQRQRFVCPERRRSGRLSAEILETDKDERASGCDLLEMGQLGRTKRCKSRRLARRKTKRTVAQDKKVETRYILSQNDSEGIRRIWR